MTVKVATANLPARRMTAAELNDGIEAVLAEAPRYVAFQEVGPHNDHTLRTIGAKHGYRLVRAKGGPPVLYLAAETEALHVRTLTLSHAQFVGHLIGRKSNLPACKATEVHFEDDELGEVVLIDAHLDAEVQFAGRYRTDKAHAPRVRRHKRQCRRLRRRARRLLGKGRQVFVCLDSNYDRLQLPPLVSCWTGQIAQGTLGNRAVDQVHSEVPSVRVKTIKTGSDHRAAVVTY